MKPILQTESWSDQMSNTKRYAHEMPEVYGTKELAEKLQRQSELVEEAIDRLLKVNKQLRTELAETKQKKADLEIKVAELEDKVLRS